MKRPRIIRFWRGARRHSKWDLGVPPNPRDSNRPIRSRFARPQFYLKAVIGVGIVGLAVLPIAADAVGILISPKEENGCRIVSVIDGDTVRLWCPEHGMQKARLVGFDTPEVFSPNCASEFARGQQATWALRWALFRVEEMSLVRRGHDRYGRVLLFVALDGTPLARTMIDAGHARFYSGGQRESWCT